MVQVTYERTADGDLAARVAHLVLGLVPSRDGSMRMLGTMSDAPVDRIRRSDFYVVGFAPTDEDGFRLEVEDTAVHYAEVDALGRTRIARDRLRGVSTPWDEADGGRRYADGIILLNTAGHGGFALSRAMNDRVHPALRAECGTRESALDDLLDPNGTLRAAGALPGAAFYEEDEQWAVVAHTFPELFTTRERRQAENTLMRSMPDEWEAATGRVVPAGFSLQRERRRFMEARQDAWIVTSAVGSPIYTGLVLVHAHLGGRQPNGGMRGAARRYLLKEEAYAARRRDSGVDECVIDEAIDVPADATGKPACPAASELLSRAA